MIQACHAIARHTRCHWDEVVGAVLLQTYGEEHFPGAKNAKLVYWTTGDNTPDGRPADSWEADGVILIGVGHGRFDEHKEYGRIPHECSATLVAKELGVMKRPELKKLLAFTLRTDEGPADHPFDVSGVMKTIHARHPDNPLIGETWAWIAIQAIINPTKGSAAKIHEIGRRIGASLRKDDKLAKYLKRIESRGSPEHPFDLASVASMMPEETAERWLELALISIRDDQNELRALAVEYVRGARMMELSPPWAKYPIRVVTIESESEKIATYARSSLGSNAGIVIKRTPKSGNTQIFPDKRRIPWELTESIYHQVLAVERLHGGKGEWYFHKPVGTILNGSLSYPDAPPTDLSLEQITEIVTDAVMSFESAVR